MPTSVFSKHLKTIRKRIFALPFVHRIMGMIVRSYLRIVEHTTRWQQVDEHYMQDLVQKEKGFIVVFWHNRLALMSFLWAAKKPFYMLISGHRDGKIIAEIIKKLGISTVHGSTSKNSILAFKTLVSLIGKGHAVGITPDGPRGPIYSVSEGVAYLSFITQSPILCIGYAQAKEVSLKTWDNFVIPLPFTRGVKGYAHPISPPKDKLDLEKTTEIVSLSLRSIQHQAQMKVRE